MTDGNTCGSSPVFASGRQILQGIDLELQPKEFLGIIGPNGSGKSTLIKLANGLLTPTQGTILVDGKEPGIETKKIVSYLPERTYLTEWMTVQDMLDLFNDFYADFNIAKARRHAGAAEYPDQGADSRR